jgi:hypothetical protein
VETIWSKSFVQKRERFDGADVAHQLLNCADCLDWLRLPGRSGADWRVLLGDLVLRGSIYPSERQRVPDWPMDELLGRLHTSLCDAMIGDCVRGSLLSRQQYVVDAQAWGLADPRARPEKPMTDHDFSKWTEGMADDRSNQTGRPARPEADAKRPGHHH